MALAVSSQSASANGWFQAGDGPNQLPFTAHQSAQRTWQESDDSLACEPGAASDVNVHRSDWAARGVQVLRVKNVIAVHNGKLAGFASNPRNTRGAE